MRNDTTDITIILDSSGSMGSIKKDTIGGFNTFLATQKNSPGEANLTLVTFSDDYHETIKAKPVKETDELSANSYRPSGNTCLLGAIGRAIMETGVRLEKIPEPERPGKVIVLVITDGEENSSQLHEWSRPWADRAEIAKMIKHQTEAYQWQFVFIGANQDAIANARNLHIPAANAINYAATKVGTEAVFMSMGNNLRSVRSGRKADMAWETDQIKAQVDAGAKDH